MKFMSKLNHVFVLLGGNIEPREEYFTKAIHELQQQLGEVKLISSIYETEAWGFETENKFLNLVLQIDTIVTSDVFLKKALEIELELGRKRNLNNVYSSRTIDIDLLYFNSEIINTDSLIIPHPRLHLRKFTLIPLVEIAPDFEHPCKRISNKELLSVCDDRTTVVEFGKLN